MSDGIIADHAPVAVGAYPHARWAGPFLYLSGVGPRSPVDNSIPEGIEAQCHAVFANVRQIIEASGATFEELIDVTVFLTNMNRDFEIYNRIYGAYFAQVMPCRTTVEISSLPTPIDIELKCIAYRKL